MSYHRLRPGPDLDTAFLVLEGLAVVEGIERSVTLPAGTIWPGVARLSAHLTNVLMPSQATMCATGVCVPWVASPRDVELCDALVLVQLLRQGDLLERLTLLDTYCSVTAQNRSTTAQLVGVARETLTAAIRPFMNMTRAGD